MFGIGIEELIVIFVIALFVVGPERLPSLARDLGKVLRELRRTSDELTEQFLHADDPRPEPPVAEPPPAATPAPAETNALPAESTAAPGEATAVPVESTASEDTTDFDRKAQADADRAREQGKLMPPSAASSTPREPERWG